MTGGKALGFHATGIGTGIMVLGNGAEPVSDRCLRHGPRISNGDRCRRHRKKAFTIRPNMLHRLMASPGILLWQSLPNGRDRQANTIWVVRVNQNPNPEQK